MTFDYLKNRKELVSVVLLGISVFLGVLILISAVGSFVTSARAEKLIGDAVARSELDPNAAEKYLAQSKETADKLKKKNLFAPPAPKKHPVKEVSGILGSEVLIKGKWYKVNDKVGDAKIVAIEPTFVRIEWGGKEKIFAPISAAGLPEASKQPKAGKEDGDRTRRRPRRGGTRVFRSATSRRERVREIAEKRRMLRKAREAEVVEREEDLQSGSE
ncbi:MAG: hypothetical protein ACYS9T_10890 [Planctomycetota bacterium]|jgi:hypothetical protein